MNFHTFHWYDVIGITGVIIILVTYFLLQCEKIESTGYTYSILNVIGSLLILYSLWFEWNLSAVIIEVCWALISFIGVARQFMSRLPRR